MIILMIQIPKKKLKSQDKKTDIEECKKIIGTVYDSLPKTIKHNS